MKHANACVRAFSSGAVPRRTLWHELYDCEERALEVDFHLGDDAEGRERRSGYLRFQLER